MTAESLKLHEPLEQVLGLITDGGHSEPDDELLGECDVFQVPVYDPCKVVNVFALTNLWKVYHNFVDAQVDCVVDLLTEKNFRPLAHMFKRAVAVYV